MFNLIYRDGAPENAGHYEVLKKNDGSGSALAVGQLVSISEGIAKKYDKSGKPYGVVAISAADGEDSVAVLRITDDMIFSATGTACAPYAPENLKGNCAELTHDGVKYNITSVDTGYAFEITGVVSCETDDYGQAGGRAVLEGRFVNLG